MKSKDDRYHIGMKIVAIRKFHNGWQSVRVENSAGSFTSYEWMPRWRPVKKER